MEKSKNVLDHYETVAEELNLNGFNVKIVQEGYNHFIEHETVAGMMRYSCSEKTTMGDYYRFISHLGSKLHKWGLDKKINQST